MATEGVGRPHGWIPIFTWLGVCSSQGLVGSGRRRRARRDVDYSHSSSAATPAAVQVNLSHINVLLIFENHNSNYHPFTD